MTTVRDFGSLTVAGVAEVEVVKPEGFTILGVAGGRQFVKLEDGRVAVVRGPLEPWEQGNLAKPGELRLSRRVPSGRHVGPSHVTEFTVAHVVADDAFDQAQQRDQAKAAATASQANPPHKRVDALLSRYPRLQAKAAELVHLEAGPTNPIALALSRAVTAVAIPSRQPVRGFDAILRVVESEADLLVFGDPPQLDAVAKVGRLSQDIVQLIDDLEPYLLAVKLGDPIRCALPHPKGKAPIAVTLAVPSRPACRACMDEEFRP